MTDLPKGRSTADGGLPGLIRDYADAHPDYMMCFRQHSGMVRGRQGRMRLGRAGDPDNLLSICGLMVLCESKTVLGAKRSTGDTAVAQANCAQRARRSGTIYIRPTSMDEFVAAVDKIRAWAQSRALPPLLL
jgi:hypothetical protein